MRFPKQRNPTNAAAIRSAWLNPPDNRSAAARPDEIRPPPFSGNSAGKNKNEEGEYMNDLNEYEMQETSGGAGIPSGVTPWAIFVLIASSWTEIKSGFADGWSDSSKVANR